MTGMKGIHNIRILDLVSGSTLLSRSYVKDFSDDIQPDILISTVLSFTQEFEDQEITNTIMLKNQKVILETTENLAFIAVVSAEYESLDAKRILSHVRASFLRQYPVRDCQWQFGKDIKFFDKFEKILDEIVRHFSNRKVVMKFVLIGRGYAGKTTLTHAYAGTNYQGYLPTLGLDILRIEYKNKHIHLWDLGGQRQFRSLWPKFATEASGIIFVVDSTTTQWVETKEVFEISKLFHLPIVIFANKQDLVETAHSVESIADKLDVPASGIVRGSALLNEGVFDVLDRLLEEIEVEFQSPRI